MGGILEHAGIPGFLSNLEEFYEASDAEGVADLWQIAEESPLPLGNGSERSRRIRLGKLLARQRDRQYDDLRILSDGSRKKLQQWRLLRVGSSDGDQPDGLNEESDDQISAHTAQNALW